MIETFYSIRNDFYEIVEALSLNRYSVEQVLVKQICDDEEEKIFDLDMILDSLIQDVQESDFYQSSHMHHPKDESLTTQNYHSEHVFLLPEKSLKEESITAQNNMQSSYRKRKLDTTSNRSDALGNFDGLVESLEVCGADEIKNKLAKLATTSSCSTSNSIDHHGDTGPDEKEHPGNANLPCGPCVFYNYKCMFCTGDQDHVNLGRLKEHIFSHHFKNTPRKKFAMECPVISCSHNFLLGEKSSAKTFSLSKILHHMFSVHDMEFSDNIKLLHCSEDGCDYKHISIPHVKEHKKEKHTPGSQQGISAGGPDGAVTNTGKSDIHKSKFIDLSSSQSGDDVPMPAQASDTRTHRASDKSVSSTSTNDNYLKPTVDTDHSPQPTVDTDHSVKPTVDTDYSLKPTVDHSLQPTVDYDHSHVNFDRDPNVLNTKTFSEERSVKSDRESQDYEKSKLQKRGEPEEKPSSTQPEPVDKPFSSQPVDSSDGEADVVIEDIDLPSSPDSDEEYTPTQKVGNTRTVTESSSEDEVNNKVNSSRSLKRQRKATQNKEGNVKNKLKYPSADKMNISPSQSSRRQEKSGDGSACHFYEYRCMFCKNDPLFDSWPELNNHIFSEHFTKIDKGYKMKCSRCPKVHTRCTGRLRIDVILYHLYKKHGQPLPEYMQKHTCPVEDCGYVTLSRYHMNSHRKGTHNTKVQVVCETCGKSMVQGSLFLHKRYSCSGLPVSEVVCSLCGKKFKSELHLNKHVRTIHSEKKEPGKICQFCSYQVKHDPDLEAHMWREHDYNPKNLPVLKCDLCPYTNIFPKLLHRHKVNFHRTWKCKICYQIFERQGAYMTHYEKLHSDKVYKCDQCEYSTKHRAFYRKHVNAQHKKRIFPCKLCDYTSGYKENIIKHMKHKHGHVYTKNKKK